MERRVVASLAVALALGAGACTSGPAASPVDARTSVAVSRPAAADPCVPPPPAPTTWATFDAPPDPASVRGRSLDATIRTTCGSLEVRLDGAAAPRGVASFVQLARSGWWRDSVCHRLTSYLSPLRFLQCGDPTGHDVGHPGYDVPLENVPADGHYVRGMLAGARGGLLRGGAGQFLVVYADFTVPTGGPRYPVIGRVTRGLEAVDAVAARGGEDTRPDGPPFRSVSILDVVVRPS
ncbi:peptidylprolyl isomerase [Intrasporangium sp. YIM S08009]|uniref:peptidylprolyl isomerase n=1 Tax=Intrasporangium zincisolvens TaxID=3080018 RepID=UPI002B053E68|nr:peptidylprolyl isomerase [Intrasporangium sp. YIM S08009]